MASDQSTRKPAASATAPVSSPVVSVVAVVLPLGSSPVVGSVVGAPVVGSVVGAPVVVGGVSLVESSPVTWESPVVVEAPALASVLASTVVSLVVSEGSPQAARRHANEKRGSQRVGLSISCTPRTRPRRARR